MGDRATVLFGDGHTDYALVYLHTEGSNAHELLETFFQSEVDNPLHDNRFDDPEYLAARFVVFMYERFGKRGMGVSVGDPRAPYDGKAYRVLCANEDRPGVVPLDGA